MRRRWYGLVLGLAAFTGCIELPILHEGDHKPAPKAERPRPEPITANEIDEANAPAKADALQREIDEDEKATDLSAAKAVEQNPPR